MCGIVGIAATLPVNSREWLGIGRDALRHRGPDDSGEWWSSDGRVGLAHRRLAIIDLSAAGHQPMSDASGGVHIVFNGEIYNYIELRDELSGRGHHFVSKSDTEVILAAYREWGLGCLSRLNGMFAWALHDGPRQQLLLARDRSGEKPLFYTVTHRQLRFASELKALFADPQLQRRLDVRAIDCYLAMGYVPGEMCIAKGFNKLPPAHALIFDLANGTSRSWRFWNLPEEPMETATAADDESALLDELEPLVADAVRRQLVSDVPVGVLLSGGVDSSLIAAMAVRAAPRVKTFTIRFPGHGAYDETEHARLIARHFNTEHFELDAHETSVELLPLLAHQFDEPIVDSSMIPTYQLSHLVRQHCTVALGGDGGDELFGGYHHYNRLVWMRRRMGWIPIPVRSMMSAAGAIVLPVGFRGRNWLADLELDLRHDLPLTATCFDRASRRKLMAIHGDWQLAAESAWKGRLPPASEFLQRATRMDFENYLAEDILVKVDRSSMLNSLEVRAPLLDFRVIEFAFGKVSARLRASANNRKVLLKSLAARLLPPQFDNQRKQGFSIPLAAWLQRDSWKMFFREVLLGSLDSFFHRKSVEALLDGQARGLRNSERLFALVLFELWRREYRMAL